VYHLTNARIQLCPASGVCIIDLSRDGSSGRSARAVDRTTAGACLAFASTLLRLASASWHAACSRCVLTRLWSWSSQSISACLYLFRSIVNPGRASVTLYHLPPRTVARRHLLRSDVQSHGLAQKYCVLRSVSANHKDSCLRTLSLEHLIASPAPSGSPFIGAAKECPTLLYCLFRKNHILGLPPSPRQWLSLSVGGRLARSLTLLQSQTAADSYKQYLRNQVFRSARKSGNTLQQCFVHKRVL